MKKACVFGAGLLLLVFLTYACEMPTSIKFMSDKLVTNAPVKIARFNLATVLSEAVKDSFPEGFEIYDLVDYPNTLAFLIGYPMVLLESFNPDDYLNDIRNQMNTMDELAPDESVSPNSITIPKMTTDAIDAAVSFYMQDFFDNMRDIINADTKPKAEPNVVYSYHLPHFMVFKDGDITLPYFDSINVDTGNIILNIWLKNVSNPGLTVDLSGISFGAHNYTQPVHLTSSHNEGNPYQVIINIDGAVINKNNPPEFILNGITPLSGYTLVMHPQIKDITLSSANNLKIGWMEEEVPAAIRDNIKLEPVADMLNVKVADGKFRMEAQPLDNWIIGYRITMKQAPVIFEGRVFEGLNDTFIKKDSSQGDPSLAGKLISGSELAVDNEKSRIILQADPVNGTTFNLSGGYVLPIEMDMGIDINILEAVRWKGNALHPIDVPPIDFSGGGESENSFIKTITFSEMKLDIDFVVPEDPATSGLPDELRNRLALRVNCPELGFTNNIPGNPRILTQDENEFIAAPKKLYVDDSNPAVKLDISLSPVINGQPSPYLEFGPVIMGSDGYKISIYAQVNMDYKWKEAEIDMQATMKRTDRDADSLKGTFPDSSGDPVDLSKVGKYMKGITLGDNIEAKMFLGGPRKLIDIIKPELDFSVQWKNNDGVMMTEALLNRHIFLVDEELPALPGKDSSGEWVYSGLDLPEPDHGLIFTGSFKKIFADFPEDMRFHHEMILPGAANPLTVYPDTFDDADEGEDGKLKALLVFIFPMEFTAEPGGYFAIPGDIFGVAEGEDAADLFGRTSVDDASLFTGVNIKSLGIKMNFGNSFFAGSNLHFDRDDILFGENGYPLGEDNSFNVIFTGDQQNIINDNLIYPDIKFVFPQRRNLQLVKYFLPVRIVIAASGSLTLNLDDLGLGN